MINVLLCATNAGGVKNLIPIAALKEQGIAFSFVSNSGFAPLLETVEPVIHADKLTGPDRSRLLDGIDLLICGTTCEQDSPERRLIAEARKKSIPSLVVFDEWYNYIFRFEGGDGQRDFPDLVAVQDQLALNEAAQEGVPADIMRITGSPSLSQLAEKIAKGHFTALDTPDVLRAEDAIRITFLSETHARDYGSRPGESGPMGNFIGYTEDDALTGLLSALGQLDERFVLCNKLHPGASMIDVGTYEVPPNVRLEHVISEPLWPMLVHSDLVVGMRSMALLESAMLGRPTVSFQPGGLGREHCTTVRLGVAPRLETRDDLIDWLRKTMVPGDTAPGDGRFDFAPPDASRRVLEAGLELLEKTQ